MNDHDKGTHVVLDLNSRNRTMSIQTPAVAIERPYWDNVEFAIDKAFQHGGYVRLRVLRPEVVFTKLLDMTSIPGRFRLVTLTKFVDPKDELREWWEPSEAPFRGTERFGDDDWDARTVCTDVSVAKLIFKDLFDHGELTESSLSQMRSNWNPRPR